MQDITQARAFTDALGGGVFDFRAIHDKDRGVQGVNFRGTIDDVWSQLVTHNTAGYGCFCVVNESNGGRVLAENITRIRAHFVDLDNLNAMQNLARANDWSIKPAFMVQSSANKAHVYWPVVAYAGNDRFSTIQKKLIQFFDADPVIFDAPRVMRLPGTLHQKGTPQLVTCSALSGFGYVTPIEYFEQALEHVNIVDFGGARHELGDPDKAAPSLTWVQFALDQCDPNDLDRGEWIGFTAAIKQCAWSLADPDTIFNMWSAWCDRYEFNDIAENRKQWDSIQNAQLGWNSIKSRVPAVKAHASFAGITQQPMSAPVAGQAPVPPMPAPEPPTLDGTGELLTAGEQAIYFQGCAFIANMGKILTPSGRMMNVTQFNAEYGGKKFIIDEQAKVVNEPWQAATRSTLGTIQKVDHIRFLPHVPHLDVHVDELGRAGVNTYKPANINLVVGDPAPFLNHLARILPNENDQHIFLQYLAHNVKFPGYKIPWAPLLQSAEGVGKGIFKAVMRHAMGSPYVYYPKAKEMAESGSKFNAWMRAKLFILVDEIRTDERRDMIEILKDFISEKEIEIQGKGSDQDKEDNYSNWMFFSNWKDAIPINKNGRRFSINYSGLQTAEHILAAGMDDPYFNWLFDWIEHQNGGAIVANYLKNYPIEFRGIPMRAPQTSSTQEALQKSRSPLEKMVLDAVEDAAPGFRGGYVSSLAVANRIKQVGQRAVSTQTIASVLEQLGYTRIGRATRPYFTEDANNKAEIYHIEPTANVAQFGQMQGYEA